MSNAFSATRQFPILSEWVFGQLVTAFLIRRTWLLCSRMFPSRSTAWDDVKLWLPKHKCIICGVEVEFTQVGVHYQTTHPDYDQWGNHWKRLSWLLLMSDVALVVLDAFFIRSVIPYSQDIVLAYLLGSMLVIIFTLVSKQRAFREAWQKAHPSSSSQVA
ncbi:hypothetical protein AUF78_07630 [archaeon 13_1_20CM_2_51_12]|nr:MAG: hypothetical protein AUF78_07630 [archaeon 13_1_20CM_2_51_12]